MTGSLHTGLHAGHGDAELGGGLLVGLAVDVDSGEGVVRGWGQLVEERLQASSELSGGFVGQVVGRAEVGPAIRVVERIVTVPGAVVVDDRVAG